MKLARTFGQNIEASGPSLDMVVGGSSEGARSAAFLTTTHAARRTLRDVTSDFTRKISGCLEYAQQP